MPRPTEPTAALLLGSLLWLGGCAATPPAAGVPAQRSVPAAPDEHAGDRASSAGPGGAGSAAGPGQTADERIAAIDRRLESSLGAFDAELRKEQQKIAQERDARANIPLSAPAADGSASGSSGSAEGAAAEDALPGEPGVRAGAQGGAERTGSDRRAVRSGDLKSERASNPGTAENAGNGATARDIPDGSDDDVIARRLRKAAEQETDPELKDKLWKEYIDYKTNAQRQ